MMRLRLPFILLAFVAATPSPLCAEPTDEIDAFIEQALNEFEEVPGLAAAVVTRDGAILLKGYGETRLDRDAAPVTPDTPFYAASVTKVVTALTVHRLADLEVIDLNQTISEAAPDIQFPTSVLPEQVRLIDLINLRHGFLQDGAEFRLAYSGEHDPATLAALWERLTPNPDAAYGEFAYGNVSFNLLTWIIEAQTGRQWRNLVSEHVLKPLGMDATTARVSSLAPETLARSYLSFSPDYPSPVTLEKRDDTMHSAGGLMASAADLAAFVGLQLDASAGRKTALRAATILRTHEPATQVDAAFAGIRRTGYGGGWYTGVWDGARILHCFGQFGGSRAHVSFSPDEGVGVVVLANDGGYGAFLVDEIARYAYDVLRASPGREERASTRLADLRARGDAIRASNLAKAEQRANDDYNLSAPAAAYTGAYTNEDFGDFVIEVSNGELVGSSGHVVLQFTPTGRDDLPIDIVRYQLLYHGGYARFSMANGQPTSMRLLGDPFLGAIFTRVEN